jgi:predicted ABC-type ATPase
MSDKNLYIIAGCNGAGKTTASYTILPEIIDCKEFVNADEIARGLSPFQPETAAFEAGRIMINRINDLIDDNETFAFETTLSTRSYRNKVQRAQEKGYSVTLLFFWLNSVELAKERVKTRVVEGGHNIPEQTIVRRYFKGINNLFDIYLPLVDGVLIFDNSHGKHELMAHKMGTDELVVDDQNKFQKLNEIYDRKR